MYFRIIITVLYFYMDASAQQFTNEILNQTSGIYFENQGPIKIRTTKWDLTAYINLTNFDKQWNEIDKFMNGTQEMCDMIKRNIDTNCGEFWPYTLNLHCTT